MAEGYFTAQHCFVWPKHEHEYIDLRQGACPCELSELRPGDHVRVEFVDEQKWAFGRNMTTDKRGWFPRNHVAKRKA